MRLQHFYADHLCFDSCSLGLLCLRKILQVVIDNFVCSAFLAGSAFLASCSCHFTLLLQLLRLLQAFKNNFVCSASLAGSALLANCFYPLTLQSSCLPADLHSTLAILNNTTHSFLLQSHLTLISTTISSIIDFFNTLHGNFLDEYFVFSHFSKTITSTETASKWKSTLSVIFACWWMRYTKWTFHSFTVTKCISIKIFVVTAVA